MIALIAALEWDENSFTVPFVLTAIILIVGRILEWNDKRKGRS